MKHMEFATKQDVNRIMDFYREVVETVNASTVKLGWNTEVYPDETFVSESIEKKQMCIMKDGDTIIAAAVVNHNVNEEYDLIDWQIKEPADRIATIHALATAPSHRGKKLSDQFLQEIDAYCKSQKDVAFHLDVIDTNIPAYKLYLRNGYSEIACIKMYYEVVGTREFWMLEKVL